MESLFIAFRLTGNRKYRAYGWNIFQAIQKHARIESGGYATVLDINNVDSEKEDKMETFFLVSLPLLLSFALLLRSFSLKP